MLALRPYDGPLPAAPGTSPFQLKGLIYLTMVEEANELIEGGFAALRAMLSDAALARYCGQTFLAMSFYDALPVIPISIAMSQALEISYADGVRSRAERRALHDLQIYRPMWKNLSSDQVFAGLMRVWPRYFDFGRVSIKSLGPGHWEVLAEELPAMLLPWFVLLAEGYICAVLRASGVVSPTVEIVHLPGQPYPPGLALSSMQLDVKW